ncbi:MAG: hypothetical protein IT259_09270 [Saprospiraceae bacterium]|nr:hypothetical protein [Saprospiraceae bacterium]
MNRLQSLLTITLVILICVLGKTQNETGFDIIDNTAGQSHEKASANLLAFAQKPDYFIGTWHSKKSNLQGEEEVLTLKFHDTNTYSASLINPHNTMNWGGFWSYSNNILLLKNEKGETNSSGLKIKVIDLNQFETTEGRFTRERNSTTTYTDQQKPIVPVLLKDKVVGTWQLIENGQFYQSEIYLTMYSDFRLFAVPKEVNFPCSGAWKLEGDLLIPVWDDPKLNPFSMLKILETGNGIRLADLSKNTASIKRSDVPIAFPISYVGQNLHAQKTSGNLIQTDKLCGTWQTVTGDGTPMYFTFYQDQRYHTCNGSNGCWTFSGDMFYTMKDHDETPRVNKVTSFSNTRWTYESVDDGKKYVAVKVSDLPQENIKQYCKQPAGGGIYIKELHCSCCTGSGDQQCGSCSGNGSQDVREPDGRGGYRTYRKDCGNCSSGKVNCRCCNGTGKQ